jgi:folate-binding protein YgfZ
MIPSEMALRDGVAVVENLPRAVYRLTGERSPLAYLHDVLAQDVAELGAGRGALSAVLTANGRVAAEVRVLPLGQDVVLDAEVAASSGIDAHIVRHAPLAGVDVQNVSDRFAVSAVRGPRTADALRAAGLPVPGPDEAAFVRAGDVMVVRVRWGVPGVDLIGPADAVPSIDASAATLDELEAARIEAGRPRFGVDVNEDVLVNETPLLARGVSMTKGCYPGQESVARIHNLGTIRRALRSVRSTGSLRAGGNISMNGTSIGRVTSAAPMPGGGASGIALLSADVEPGASVTIDGDEAIVGTLP